MNSSVIVKNYAELFHSQGYSPINNSNANLPNYVSSNQYATNNTQTNANSVNNQKYANNASEYSTNINRSNSYAMSKKNNTGNINLNLQHASNDYGSKSGSMNQNQSQRLYLKKDIDHHVKFSNVKLTPKNFVRKTSVDCHEVSNNYNDNNNLYNTVNNRIVENRKDQPMYFESTLSKSPMRNSNSRQSQLLSTSNRLTLDTGNVQTTRPESLFSMNTNLKRGNLTSKASVCTQNVFNNQNPYCTSRNDARVLSSNRFQRGSDQMSLSPLNSRINLPDSQALNTICSKKLINQTINHSRNASISGISQNTTPTKLRSSIKTFLSLRDYCLNDICRNNNAPNIYYAGDMNKGKRIGYGKLYKSTNQNNNSRIYEGFFMQNIFEGFGYLSNLYENEYKRIDNYDNINVKNYWKAFEGKFSNGLPTGNGRLHLINDDLVEGTFEDGFLEGKAVLYKKSAGLKLLCSFKKDVIISNREIKINF